MEFYKIIKEEADTLGKMSIGVNAEFNPYCSEQKDGTFLVRKEVADILEFKDLLKGVDIKSKVKITDTEKDKKDDSIPIEDPKKDK